MATRNENLNRIRNAMGSYSPGTKNITQMNGPRYEETSRDESLRILQSALSGGSTAGTTPQSAVPAASSPYTGEPNTSSGAVAPPFPQGEGLSAQRTGRSAEQIQQEISDSRKRLEQLQLEAAYILTVEPGDGLDRQMDEERTRIKALNKELDALKAPSTNAERDSLIQRMNAITENEGYATTVELADAVTQEKQDTRQRLHQLDEELGNAARFYDSGERAGAVVKGALKQTGSAYTNFMGTLQGLGNRLHESSSAADQAVAGSDYAGWATDELTAANMAEAIIKENPDGNYLEGLQKEEQRLYEKADAVAASAAKDIAQAKEGLSALGQAGVDISVAIIQNGIDAVAKKSGLGMLPFFVRAAGGSMQEARHAGASTGQQLAYGLPKAAIEVATEWLSGGIAGTGVSGIDEVIEPLINKLAKSTAGKVALSAVYDAAMEGTEEVLSDLLDPFVKLVYNDQALKEAWENRADVGAQMLYDYLIGAVVGSIGSGTKIVTGAATEEGVAGKPVKTGAVTGQYAEKNAALGGTETQEQTGAETKATEQAEKSTAQTQEKSYPTVEELIQPIRPAGNADAEAFAPAAGGNAPVNAVAQTTDQWQTAGQQVMTQEERAQKEADWWANREKEAEKAYEDAKKRYEEALNGGNADETDFFSGPEMRKVLMNMAKKDLEDVRNRRIPSPFSTVATEAETATQQEAQTQAAETAQNAQRPTPQAETPPTTQNAAQAASGELNTQTETNTQEQAENAEADEADELPVRAAFTPMVSPDSAVQTERTGEENGIGGEIPKGAKISQFWSNTLQKVEEYARVPEEGKTPPLWYMPKSEAQSLAEAASRLKEDRQGTIQDLISSEAWSGVQNDAASSIASELYADAMESGNWEPVAAWNKVMSAHIREAARAVQSVAKYSRTGTEIAADVISKLQDSSLSPEQKKAAQKVVGKFGTEIDAAIAEKSVGRIRNVILKMNEHRGTGTFVKNNFEKVMKKIQDVDYLSEYARRQLYAVGSDYTVSETRSLGDMLKTWQVNAQLTSLGTFFRNIGGNLSFGAIDSVSQNGFALALDHLVSKKTGKRTVAADIGWFSSDTRMRASDALYKSIVEVAGDVDMGGSATRYGITSGRTFKMSGGKAERFMSRWEQLLSYSLRTSDQVFRGRIEGATQSGLERIKNSGLSAEEISQIAENTADYRLFQNEGTAAKISKGAHDVLNLIGIGGQVNGVTRQGGFGIGDLVNPYPKVPANLAVKALEYSPANIIKGGIELAKLFKNVNAAKATAQTKAQIGGTGQIAPGTVVRALDRGNYGYVQSFDGSTYSVKFTSKDGLVATKRFTPDQIEDTNAKTIEEAKRGGKSAGKALDQHQAVMDIARGMAGVPIIALCAALFKTGLVKNFDDEEDYDVMAQNAAEGKTGVQINLDAALRAFNGESAEWKDGDDLMSISWAEPINAFLAIGALIANEDDDATIGTYIGDYFDGALQSVLDMPLMSNLSGAIDTVRYSTAESLGGQIAEGALDYAASTATGFVPAPIRQAARASDPYYRNTKGYSALETAWNNLANVIPGLRQLALDVKTDNFGQPKENAGGFAQRALNALVLPGAINKLNQSDASAAVEAIYEATGDAAVYPDRKAPNSISSGKNKHSLTADEKQNYQAEAGQTSGKLISSLAESKYYDRMSDEQKAEVVKAINLYAEHKAADQIFDILGIDTKRDKWETLKGNDLISYLSVKELVSGMYDDDGKITDYSAADKLIGQIKSGYGNLSTEAKGILKSSYGMLDDLIYGQENGVGTKEIYTAKEKADVNGNGSITQEELWNYLETQVIMPSSKKSVLWDILTSGKTGYAQYAEKHK